MKWLQGVADIWRKFLFALLKGAGPIPHHVAFIMDGNRRYAKNNQIQRYTGHEHGCQKFIEVVKWCLELGVPYVSVYAFSIENFKRSAVEVEELMRLARNEFRYYKEHAVVEGYDTEVRVIGDLSKTSEKLQSSAAELMARTKHAHSDGVLHICFSYTASQEICRAVDIAQRHVEGGIGERDLLRLCFTEDCPEVDVMIRTSGETRLSDFLNLQTRNAMLVFDEVMWPDYSVWHFVSAMFQYGRRWPELQRLRDVLPKASTLRPQAETSDARPNAHIPCGASQTSDGKSASPTGNLDVCRGDAPEKTGHDSLLSALQKQKRSWTRRHARTEL